jgi:hypothetical protein
MGISVTREAGGRPPLPPITGNPNEPKKIDFLFYNGGSIRVRLSGKGLSLFSFRGVSYKDVITDDYSLIHLNVVILLLTSNCEEGNE